MRCSVIRWILFRKTYDFLRHGFEAGNTGDAPIVNSVSKTNKWRLLLHALCDFYPIPSLGVFYQKNDKNNRLLPPESSQVA